MSEQPPESTPEPSQDSQEHAPATFERAGEELRKLKALGIEEPEFTEDERASQFQNVLAELDESVDHLPQNERNEYPAWRALLFFNAGYTEPSLIEEQLEFLNENLWEEKDAGNTAEVDRLQAIADKLEQLLPKQSAPEIPTVERIGEALRQPGRLPMEAHAMIMDWKSAQLAEVGTGAQALIDVEMQAAKLYANNGRALDAIGSITAALIGNKAIKKAKPALKKALEDYREELKRR